MKLIKRELLLLIIVTFIFLLYTVFYPNITSKDDNIELGSNYTFDYKCYNLFTDLTYRSVSTGNVDTNKVGSYKVNVSIKYLFSFLTSLDLELEADSDIEKAIYRLEKIRNNKGNVFQNLTDNHISFMGKDENYAPLQKKIERINSYLK